MKVSMTFLINTEADLKTGVKKLIKADPRLAALLAVSGPPPLRRRPGGFAGLAQIVMAQQLSGASASAIWGRLSAAFDPFDPAKVRRARTDKLQRIGLSGAKIRTLRAIADAIIKEHIDFDALAQLPADEAHAKLIAIHGIGPWTADVYLLFCLGHPDAWPAGDLALQKAAQTGLSLPARPTTKEMIALAEIWRPWRGVAAKLLWAYYRATKGRDATPIQPKKQPKNQPKTSTAKA
jgi:DNA-3-methyladenine glycosylase II